MKLTNKFITTLRRLVVQHGITMDIGSPGAEDKEFEKIIKYVEEEVTRRQHIAYTAGINKSKEPD